jgi:hypothetical protein
MRLAVSSAIGLAMLFGIGVIWAADPPTLEQLAAAIDRVRAGPDGERVVVGHISRKLSLSVETLRAQQARTQLDWGELFIANLICKATPKLTIDHVAAELKGGAGWTDIARHHNVTLDHLTAEVLQSQQAIEQRSEDRAPARTESLQPTQAAPSTGSTVVNPMGGSGRRY